MLKLGWTQMAQYISLSQKFLLINLSKMQEEQRFNESYVLKHILGHGAFAEVRLGVKKSTKEEFAIKIIDLEKCAGREDMVETEINILRRIDHPNIVKLYEMFEFGRKIYLVMELVTGGELFDQIVNRGSIPEPEVARIVKTILDVIQYLHREGIVHRDLKPENLLISSASPDAEIKISDFGLSKIYCEVELMRTACGTPGYVAPEVLRRQGYGKEVDLWSLGVITYILLCGYPPFYDQRNAQLFRKIMSGRYTFDERWWGNVSDQAKDFISKLLVVDITERYTADQALAHPFIASLSLTNQFGSLETVCNEPRPVSSPEKARRSIFFFNPFKRMYKWFRRLSTRIRSRPQTC
ncbi:kinase-like domain-containing protein [Globomyces pollinis-pini]|nr:kinase-like domain-containing protein [Globomyces pollinis-pini]